MPMSTKETTHIKHVAILLTCFNRKHKTLEALKNLGDQEIPGDLKLDIFLVDDGSTDGTGIEVSKKYPEVNLIKGEGNLYWNQGMRLAWNKAMESYDYDFYLLLNDDTVLYLDAISRLIEVEKSIKDESGTTGIIVGSTMDPVTKMLTYGGNNRLSGFLGKGFRFARVAPGDKPKICDTFNANCALISSDIVSNIGILSERFTHGMGDYDYGLRAQEAGYHCWVMPGYAGTCQTNDITNTWLDSKVSLKKRIFLRNSPKGMPAEEWLYFVKRHAGHLWLLAWLQLNLRLYFPRAWSFLRRIRKQPS